MKYSSQAFILFLAALLQTASAQDTQSVATATSRLKINEKTDEERIQFLLDVARVYFDEEDYESAVNAYERILAINPDHLQARYTLAYVYIDTKQYEKSEKYLTEQIKDNPDDFTMKNNLAWLYATAQDPKFRNGDKAVRLAQEAMVLAPNNHHIWSTLSEAYYVNGEYEKAYTTIKHMASLAAQHGTGVTQEQVDGYNEQIQKCKRAWDTQKILEGFEEKD